MSLLFASCMHRQEFLSEIGFLVCFFFQLSQGTTFQPLLRAQLGRVPGLPRQERRRTRKPDQDAARDQGTLRFC